MNQLRYGALWIGCLALLISCLGVLTGPRPLMASYLFAYLFWWQVALGSLGLLALARLVGGHWATFLSPFLRRAVRTIPGLAIFFLPILLGSAELYWWREAHGDPWLIAHQPYMSLLWFAGRSLVYFGVWYVVGHRLCRSPNRGFAAFGLILYALTITWAAFDWGMSLVPHWASSIYGLIWITGQAVAGWAAMTAVGMGLVWQQKLEASPLLRQDLGNFMLSWVILWTYVTYSQFLIIWSGNLPGEITWYLTRRQDGWLWWSAGVVLCQFVIPFSLLLPRKNKAQAPRLMALAIWVLVAQGGELFWRIIPDLRPSPSWLDLALVIGLGGLWTFAFLKPLPEQVHA